MFYCKMFRNICYLSRLEDVEERLDRVAEHEDEDDPHEQGRHRRVPPVRVPLGDGVVVRMRLNV